MKKLLLIANPVAGRGNIGPYLHVLSQGAQHQGWQVETVVTSRAGEAGEIAASLSPDVTCLGCLGGDGTFNEIINGLGDVRPPLALFPSGTGNVFAKALGLFRWPRQFLHLIQRRRVEWFDLGQVENGQKFLCVADCGPNALVVHHVSDHRRGPLSKLDYLLPTLKWCLRYQYPVIHVTLDGRKICDDAVLVVAGNVPTYGGPLEFTPYASPHDGLLDVCIFHRRTELHLIKWAAGVFFRWHPRFSEVTYLRGTDLVLEPGDHSNSIPFQIDGDKQGHLPQRLRLLPRALPILVPGTYRV
jgi:diacylglycerol kinase (ATP)